MSQLLKLFNPVAAVMGGAGWKPTDLSNLSVWLDFSDTSTLYTDAGVTRVSADGNLIYQVNDKSGNGYNFTQTTEANRPAYKVGIKNGLSIARLDGSNDYLVSSSILLSNIYSTNQIDIFAVINQDSSQAQNTLINTRATDQTNTVNIFATYNDTFYFDIGAEAGGGRISGAQPVGWDNAFHILEAYRSAATGLVVVDGTTAVSNTFSDDFNNTSSDVIAVGARDFIWDVNFKGDIGELIVYKNALTTQDRAKVKTYLANKWGITVS